MATYWENSCSFGLRYVSWYKYLIVSLVFSHLGFWSGNLFLIAPFPDLCLLVPFYVPVNILFSVMSGRSQRFLGLTSKELMCLAQGHNTVAPLGIEPRTSRFGVRRPTITPPRSLQIILYQSYINYMYVFILDI